MVMDGVTMDVGAVGYLRRVKNAIGVARAVMLYTTQTLLAGDGATQFAVEMGFTEETLTTPNSQRIFQSWLNASCQPNYWQHVVNQSTQCPPYAPIPDPLPPGGQHVLRVPNAHISRTNHDTIGMLVWASG